MKLTLDAVKRVTVVKLWKLHVFQVNFVLCEDGIGKGAAFMGAVAMRLREGGGDTPRTDVALSGDVESGAEATVRNRR